MYYKYCVYRSKHIPTEIEANRKFCFGRKYITIDDANGIMSQACLASSQKLL